MGIHNILTNTLKTKWTWTDDFSFFFYNNLVEIPNDLNLSQAELWEMSVINIDLPQVGANVNTVVIGQEYRFWVSLHETFNFTVTFRDTEKMKLKEYFTRIWVKQQSEYYDDAKSTVKIVAGEGIMYASSECLIQNISQTQLDNSNTQIAEFSVEFISKSLTNNTIEDFSGWEEYRNKNQDKDENEF